MNGKPLYDNSVDRLVETDISVAFWRTAKQSNRGIDVPRRLVLGSRFSVRGSCSKGQNLELRTGTCHREPEPRTSNREPRTDRSVESLQHCGTHRPNATKLSVRAGAPSACRSGSHNPSVSQRIHDWARGLARAAIHGVALAQTVHVDVDPHVACGWEFLSCESVSEEATLDDYVLTFR